MEKELLSALYDQDLRINAEYPGTRREITPDVVRLVDVSNNFGGAVLYSSLDDKNADTVIREQVEYFRGLHQDFGWNVLEYDRPADLQARLEKQGFIPEEMEAVLVLDMETAPVSLWKSVNQDIRRVIDPAELETIRGIEEKVWDEDFSWVLTYLGGALREAPGCMSTYLVYVDNVPASAAWIHYPPGGRFASLFGGATLNQYRGQGLYTSLLAIRAQEARERGVRYLTVDASPMSQPILEKRGFELLAWSTPCEWKYDNADSVAGGKQ